MNKKTGTVRCVLLLLLVLLFLSTASGCVLLDTLPANQVLVTWVDADGTLLEYEKKPSSYDPANRPLPEDSDEWHYTGWNIVREDGETRCTALRVQKLCVKWLDADGTLLNTAYLPPSEIEQASFPLPEDTEGWRYLEWVKSASGQEVTFKAVRVALIKYVWQDADQTVIKQVFLPEGEEPTAPSLPQSNERWVYEKWILEEQDGGKIFTADRMPNTSYFSGNVFQIVIKDRYGNALGAGSGFILNDEGWFITNNHVMDGAYSATAYFDIPDQEGGTKYTELKVSGGVYNSAEKDVFIGKLAGYSKIQKHYKAIAFTEDYRVGETTYSVGYPNSSVTMEINKGTILEEYSTIADKINGVYYILSDSYIAPGSSGGILINKDFQVLGITSIGVYADESHLIYQGGGSIPTLIFSSKLQSLNSKDLKKLSEIYR
ncbi:MAG: trypsin-like peptidase domain-containing protein [Clostridia bacterium]|nr:trypsin-like peptidase domain-containing protein [Clostridia bacterium]